MTAGILAQIQHHVFDRAVFPSDLPVRLDDGPDCIKRKRALFAHLVIIRPCIQEAVQRDKGCIPHFIVGAGGFRIFGANLRELAARFKACGIGVSRVPVCGDFRRKIGIAIVQGMAVIQPDADQIADSPVRRGSIAADQLIIQADLGEIEQEAVYVMIILDAVQDIQLHCQLPHAVIPQGQAAFGLGAGHVCVVETGFHLQLRDPG